MDIPNREEVAAQWNRVINREITREEAHVWAKPWVEERDDEIADPMVRSALLRLHGFDMIYVDDERRVVRHGGDGPYVHASASIAAAFGQWKAKCRHMPS
ncbi:hypothetical protein [Glycomyces buryatensis]|uniref:Uncharacterized protein n=1 Tax=Glycomyces buryatensis TaxID=2570927 RepID=A0A4S8QCQ4_9ACTN|nr:hypothetical protein [Glycomyces buryatensis]THV40802.1 hypothetical protein FAB82_14230 [Glycomyces buryatensis]